MNADLITMLPLLGLNKSLPSHTTCYLKSASNTQMQNSSFLRKSTRIKDAGHILSPGLELCSQTGHSRKDSTFHTYFIHMKSIYVSIYYLGLIIVMLVELWLHLLPLEANINITKSRLNFMTTHLNRVTLMQNLCIK